MNRGFTLIEMMVGLVIVALLLTLGVPTFTTFLRNSEIRSTAEALINGLRTANTQAANLNREVVFTVRGSGDSWTAWDITYIDTDTEDGKPQPRTIQQFTRGQVGNNSSVTATPPAASEVRFTSLGRVKQDAATPHIQSIEICIDSCTVGSQYRPLRIYVDDPTGKNGLRVCDPDPNLLKLSPPDPRACLP